MIHEAVEGLEGRAIVERCQRHEGKHPERGLFVGRLGQRRDSRGVSEIGE